LVIWNQVLRTKKLLCSFLILYEAFLFLTKGKDVFCFVFYS
jgi:hypothetical protein